MLTTISGVHTIDPNIKEILNKKHPKAADPNIDVLIEEVPGNSPVVILRTSMVNVYKILLECYMGLEVPLKWTQTH